MVNRIDNILKFDAWFEYDHFIARLFNGYLGVGNLYGLAIGKCAGLTYIVECIDSNH